MIIDMHSHILPYVDDGAADMAEAVAMVQIAAQSGVRTMIATPHANQRGLYENYATERMQEIFEKLRERIRQQGIPVTILPGMEIFASEDMIRLIRHRLLCPIAGTNLFLVEFPFGCPEKQMERLLKEMLWEGYLPLLAHPERYYCVQDRIECLQNWQEMGCYIQMNKGSVFNRFGPQSGETARRMLEMGLLDVIGSDAHGADVRTPDMTSIVQYLTERYGEKRARLLLEENPKRLLGGENFRKRHGSR